MKYIKTISCFLLLWSLTINRLYSQQDAMYTHYMYNTLAVNPAYAGTRDALTITGLNRLQWVGFDGAPRTQTLTMHTPFVRDNLGLGMSFINDKIGPLKTTSFYLDFAYVIKTGVKSKLSFGLKGGGALYQAGLNSLELDNGSDVSFQNNSISELLPNFGFGVYYFRERFYAGVSTPKLLQNSIQNSTVVIRPEQRHYFLIIGSVFNLTTKLKFKPTSYLKVTEGAPIEADITATFIVNEKIHLCMAYRTGDALAGMLGYQVNDQFLVGYSYDWSFTVQTGKYNSGSHELMLRYDFYFKDKQKVRSPRYF